ncbi:MAG: hypothetical protein GC181_00920 [Bacteroidetes bacterium]|nr:hypothetical protein [Bacteroidota bacterium]
MKTLRLFLILFLFGFQLSAQNSAVGVEKYTLPNNLTVYLNPDPDATQVYGLVVVKVGSKNDPADATGMAHYLEHMLFKGTTEMGTSDYEKEKPHLDSINMYYDLLGKTTDKEERKRIQEKINEQSIKASKYGLPTEFDKLIKSIGGTALNAFTTNDITCYYNAFPTEQMDKWLELYSHRFQNPVFRSFQSELEVVYEEKNLSMDGIEEKLFEELNKNLFKNHPYGTQTTIGTVEHLKNPSLNRMYEYFHTYYVANNMALVLSGNFNPGEIKPMIEHHFSQLKQGKIPEFPKIENHQFSKDEQENVRYTPIRMELIGYKTIPDNHPDYHAMEVLSYLLSNGSETGALNKLQREHKLMEADLFNYNMNDDGSLVLIIVPKIIGQSFKSAEKLVMDALDSIRTGNFPDDLLQMVKTELTMDHERSLENYESRAFNIAFAYGSNSTWEDYLAYSDKIDKITKADVQRVAEKYLTKHRFTLRSRTGSPPKTVLEKPGFKPVVTDQTEESVFAKQFQERKIAARTPRFIDPEKDVYRTNLNESNKLFVTRNPVNDIFSMNIAFWVGDDTLKNLELAMDLSDYFHTKDMDLDQTKDAFAKLGLSWYTYSNRGYTMVQFTGLEKNLQPSLDLINQIIYEPQVEEKVIDIMYDEEKAIRKYELKDPRSVGVALFDYATNPSHSPYLNRPTLKELKKMKASELLKIFQELVTYNASWHFVGKTSGEEITKMLRSTMKLANNHKESPLTKHTEPQTPINLVYLTNDKKSVQSQINFRVPSVPGEKSPWEKARVSAFNNYMDGDFSGLIMQEIREYRSLAYSAYGYFSAPYQNDSSGFTGYIGCQADKTVEAIRVMKGLLDSMPQKPDRIETIREGLKNSSARRYPNFRVISYSVDWSEKIGSDYLFGPDEYVAYDSLTFDDVMKVYNTFIVNRPIIITASGNLKRMNAAELKTFGKLIYVKKKDLFVK